ncbi:flagellar assembly protein FliH [Psychrobacillus vulpis]|uniref:Flagellar assembly protein FliH n=1 Tax=Psychrobacillus vulpis TaxID=2325572 RepID=A0A544TU32_9BACI|nr:flagellar assembly protein FliH [Psychrobacillus vulpis]
MSRIFRSVQMKENSEQIRPIQIINLNEPKDLQIDQNLSLDVILKERDKMVREANEEIDFQKEELAKEIEQSKQFISDQLNAWEEQKSVFQQAAYDEGFALGQEEGRNKAKADMQQDLALANETIQTAHENAANYVKHQEQVILELAIRTAERIIGAKLEENEELFLSIVKRGIKEAREMKEIKLYVSPTYFALVSSNRDELASIFPVDVPFMIFVDEDMNSRDCYIETNHGRIVVSIDEQLQELRLKLVDMLDSME